MNILVINGSPKKVSDTMCMTNAFLEGIKTVLGNECCVKTITVSEKNIGFCRGCFSCWKNEGKCAQNDDMGQILDEILNSHLIIWNFPLYSFGMPGHLKTMIDRLLPLGTLAMKKVDGRYEHEHKADFSNQKYVMISGCGFPSESNNFEPAVMQFNRLFPRGKNEIITVPMSPLFNIKEAEPVAAQKLQEIKTAGMEYAQNGFISEETHGKIKQLMISADLYLAKVNSIKL